KDQVVGCAPTLTIPADARVSEPYWHRAGDAGRYTFDADAPFGLPNRPTPFYAQVTMTIAGSAEEVIGGLPVQYRYAEDIFSGEKRSDVLVAPAYSVRVSPEVAIIPTAPPAPPAPPAPVPTTTQGRGNPPTAATQGRGAAAAAGARGATG